MKENTLSIIEREQYKFYQLYDILFSIIEVLPNSFLNMFVSMLVNTSDINSLITFLVTYLASKGIKVNTNFYAQLKNLGIELKESNVLISKNPESFTYVYGNVINRHITDYFSENIKNIKNIWGSMVTIVNLNRSTIDRREVYLVEVEEDKKWEIMKISSQILEKINEDYLTIYISSSLNRNSKFFPLLIEKSKNKLYEKKKIEPRFFICKTLGEQDLIKRNYLVINNDVKQQLIKYLSYYDNIAPNYIITREFFSKHHFKNFFISDGRWVWTTQDIFLLKNHNLFPKGEFFTYLLHRIDKRTPSIEELVKIRTLINKIFVFH